MDCFSQGNMQRHPLIKGYFFRSWRLHGRIISETSRQVSLFLDLWHAHHNLDFIKTHQPSAAEIIPHIDLLALTSHIASRILWHILLSCLGVSLLFMSCVAFLSLFVYRFMWVLVVVCMYVSLYKHHLSFIFHITTVACMTLFCMDGHCCSNPLHTHACFPFFWILHLLFAWMIIHSFFHSFHHAFRLLMLSVTRRLYWIALAQTMPCPNNIVHFWKWRLSLPSRNCASLAKH